MMGGHVSTPQRNGVEMVHQTAPCRQSWEQQAPPLPVTGFRSASTQAGQGQKSETNSFMSELSQMSCP